MRFLVDQCTGPAVAQWLRERNHEVFSVFDEAPGWKDRDILAKAVAENWIIITNDKDFGELVFRDGLPHRGIVLLRLENERMPNRIAALERLLKSHGDDLVDHFTVIHESLIRIVP